MLYLYMVLSCFYICFVHLKSAIKCRKTRDVCFCWVFNQTDSFLEMQPDWFSSVWFLLCFSSLAPSSEDLKKGQVLKEEGNALVKKGEHRKAIDKYTQSLQYNPSEVATYTNRWVESFSMFCLKYKKYIYMETLAFRLS